MVSRSTLKGMARLALAALLFAQAALVLAACDSIRRAPALAIALAAPPGDDPTCRERGGNANLCLAHCLGGDQSLDKPLVTIPALPSAPVLSLQAPLVSLHDARATRRFAVPHAAGPPPRILFQSLLI